MKKLNIKAKDLQQIAIRGGLILALVSGLLIHQTVKKSESAISSASVTLSNSRPSFSGLLAAGNAVGSSLVIINTTAGAAASTQSAQLVEGDVLGIGDASTITSYTVAATSSAASTINVTAGLASGDTESGDIIIGTQSASLSIGLTNGTAVINGKFRLLVPALANDANSNDGLPDAGYFDMKVGGAAPTVTCPADSGAADFIAAGVATASAITVGSTEYHSFECAYSGTLAASSALTGWTVASLINPAPNSTHLTGHADTYSVIIQHTDYAGTTVVDSTTLKIGVIEAVRVIASVAPQISFKITGYTSGTYCGSAITAPSTATLVQLGELAISTFTKAAQNLAVSTNGVSGYSVTAHANDEMGRNGAACASNPTASVTCIPDSPGDDAGMSHTASDDWSNSATKGFGYTLGDPGGTGATPTPAFLYSTTGGNCAGGNDCYRQFADEEASQAVVQLFNAGSVADNQNLNVCYQAIISASQPAGIYENYITYTATATF